MGMLKKIAGKIEDTVSPRRRRVKRRLKMYAGPQPGPRRRRTRRRRS